MKFNPRKKKTYVYSVFNVIKSTKKKKKLYCSVNVTFLSQAFARSKFNISILFYKFKLQLKIEIQKKGH